MDHSAALSGRRSAGELHESRSLNVGFQVSAILKLALELTFAMQIPASAVNWTANSTVTSSGADLSVESEASMASATDRTLLNAASKVRFACSVIRRERSSPQPRVATLDTSCTSTRTLPPSSSKYLIISGIEAPKLMVVLSHDRGMIWCRLPRNSNVEERKCPGT